MSTHKDQKVPVHLNNSVMCSIAIKTTGPDPRKHELLDIAIVPVNSFYEPIKEMLPFSFKIKPEGDITWDEEAVKECKISKAEIIRCYELGYPADYIADRFNDWFHQKLKMPERKKITPLAYNWPYTRDFLITWLGRLHFEEYFDYRYRDLLAFADSMNDSADWRAFLWPYEKVNLSYIYNILKVKRSSKHDALNEAVDLIELYKRALKSDVHRH